MTVKLLMACSLGLFLSTLRGESEIPAWAETEIQTTYARYLQWKGSDTAVAVPFVTDVHSFKAEIDTADNFADSKRHIRILRRAAEVFDADATADLGDMGIDCEGTHAVPSSAEHQATRLASQVTLYSDFTRPHMALVGNHDHGAATNKITNADFGTMFNGASLARASALVTGPNRDYGYLDVPGKNARIFFLNTTDTIAGNGYGISDDQVDFLRTHLAELSDGATAMVFTHYCLHQRLGRWDRENWTPMNVQNLSATVKVLEDFAARTDVHLAGVMAGDSHFNNHIQTNGVRWAISQGFGGCSASQLPQDPAPASQASFTRSSQTLIDVVAFKPATGEFRTFRIGVGGRDNDMVFTADFTGDTFTWTGAGDGLKWSDPANWSTTSTSHNVPASGDRVIMTGLTVGTVISNDIKDLSLPYLEIGGASSASPSFTIYGEKITLTGGWDALVARSGRFYCYIPFHLPVIGDDPVTRFDFASTKGGTSHLGRMDQRANITGPGRLYINYPNYWTPSCNFDYTGGTVCRGGTIDPTVQRSFGAISDKPVEVRSTQFRFYGGCSPVSNSFEEAVLRSSSDDIHTYYFWSNPKATGAFTGKRFAAGFGFKGTATFNGPITTDRVAVYVDSYDANNTCTFNGRVTTPYFNAGFNGRTDKYYTNTITYVFNASNNALGNLYLNKNIHKMGAVNALGTNTVVYPGERSLSTGLIDCQGFDQTIDRIVLNPTYPIDAGHPDGHVITSSSGPATLTLAATTHCETDALFAGDLSLVWAPREASVFSTYAAFGREMPMTGAIIVSNGCFEVNGVNAFPKVTRVELAPNTTFNWYSTAEDPGLASVQSIKIADGASFVVDATATNPFTSYTLGSCTLDLAETANLVLPEGCTLAVTEIRTNGVALALNKIYSGNPSDPDTIYLPQLSGSAGRVLAFPVSPVVGTGSTLSAKAYVQDGLLGLLDGFENIGWGQHDDAAMTWKDLKGTIGDFSVSNTVGSFTATGLKKIKSGTLAWCPSRYASNKRPGNVYTMEAAVSGLDNLGTSGTYVMPVWMGMDQMILLNLNNDKKRTVTFDNNKSGAQWTSQTSMPAATTITGFYVPLTKGNGYRIDGVVPEGAESATSDFSDTAVGLTLGGRWISWAGSDTGPYGYSLNSIRFYSRTLSEAEVTNNWVVDSFRYRGTVPVDTPDYRRMGNGSRLACRVRVMGVTGVQVSVGGSAPTDEAELWVEAGGRIQLTTKTAEDTDFDGWIGDVDAIETGTAADDTVTLRVDRALTLSASAAHSLLVVSQDTVLSADRACSGIRFTGPYTLSAVDGAKVVIDEGTQGIFFDDGVTGTAKIACPLQIGSMGAAQTIRVPNGATLEVTGALSGKANISASAPGTVKLLGGGDMGGDWSFTGGPLHLGGVFSDTSGTLTVATNAPLSLANGDLAKLLRCNYYNGTKVTSVANTTNVLRGGWSQLSQGSTPTWGFDTGANSELTFMKAFNSGEQNNYPGIKGSGTVHLRTSTDLIGCLTLDGSVKVHVWNPMFTVNRSNYDVLNASAKLYLHATNALTRSPWTVKGRIDLCGADQTMGRFSYVSSWNKDGTLASVISTGTIHSDDPAVFTVYHDTKAGGGGNIGKSLFVGTFTGQASLHRTGASDDTAMSTNHLFLAGASTATGSVYSSWGLLSFTNVVLGTKTYTGSWLNCTEAGAHTKGTLEIGHSQVFGKDVKIRVKTGGKIRLGQGVRQLVGGVYFDDETESRPFGSYGSSQSNARNKDDTRFEGPGVIVYPNPGSVVVFR